MRMRRRSVLRREREAGAREQADDVLGDADRRRETGRANAADADVARGCIEMDLVVGVLGRGAEPGVGRGDLFAEQRGQDRSAFLEQRREPAPVVAVSVLSSTSSAVGPSSTLPNTVGLTSTPLVVLVGTGSSTCDRAGARELVVDDELAAARAHGEARVSEHRVDRVRLETGGVDDEARA